jgi:competence protein ComFC
MLSTHPTQIFGPWKSGFALDYQIVSSEFVGYNEFGHPQFDTNRTELGELVYKLKYRHDKTVVPEIVGTASDFIREDWKPNATAIVIVPPSLSRLEQPVEILAEALSARLAIPLLKGAVTKNRSTPQLKNVYDYQKKLEILKGVFGVAPNMTKEMNILLFDDLYQSGATIASVAEALLTLGKATELHALTITRTYKRQ